MGRQVHGEPVSNSQNVVSCVNTAQRVCSLANSHKQVKEFSKKKSSCPSVCLQEKELERREMVRGLESIHCLTEAGMLMFFLPSS